MNDLGLFSYQAVNSLPMYQRNLTITRVGILTTTTESLAVWYGTYRFTTKIINNGLTYLIIRRVNLEICGQVIYSTGEETTLLVKDLPQAPNPYYHGY